MLDKEYRQHVKTRYGVLIKAQAAQIKVLSDPSFLDNHIDLERDIQVFLKLQQEEKARDKLSSLPENKF